MRECASVILFNMVVLAHNIAAKALWNGWFLRVGLVICLQRQCMTEVWCMQRLLQKVASWMKPGGIFFCHVFCHKTIAYHFEV
jgi:hypothetical protein